MDWKLWRRSESRADVASNAVVAAALAAARGQGSAGGDGTATAVACIGLISRLFSAATVNPPELRRLITAPILSEIARRLMLNGNAVFDLDVDGQVPALTPVAGFAVVGGQTDPNGWVYDLDIPTPSGMFQRRELGAGLIHVRLNAPNNAPWRGVSPVADAGLTSAALANVERRLGQEANARTLLLLLYPDGTTDSTRNGIATDWSNSAGNLAMAGRGGAGYNAGRAAAAPTEWDLKRIGPTIPESSIMLADSTAGRVAAALGVSPQFWAGAGTDMREAGRQLHYATLEPLARLVSAELTAKLGGAVDLELTGDGLVDLQVRARALATLTGAGMSLADAQLTVGLPTPATPAENPESMPTGPEVARPAPMLALLAGQG